MKIIEVVHLVWIDSQTTGEWTKRKHFRRPLDEIHSVGLLLHQDKEKYVLAVSWDPTTKRQNATMEIPANCVKKVRPLGAIKVE